MHAGAKHHQGAGGQQLPGIEKQDREEKEDTEIGGLKIATEDVLLGKSLEEDLVKVLDGCQDEQDAQKYDAPSSRDAKGPRHALINQQSAEYEAEMRNPCREIIAGRSNRSIDHLEQKRE